LTDETQNDNIRPACVLVVDDSLTALYLVQAVFANEHYDVVTASDGQEGLEKVAERRFDLIVTDSIMPGVDGFAFLRRLRENPATRLIPVIMLTSGNLDDPMFRDSDIQPDAYVTKSMQTEPLLNRARSLLSRPPQSL
jgi:two-component system response regulator MprA